MGAPDLVMLGHYDTRLVALSVLIAVVASYAALDLAERVTFARVWTRHLWLSGGATAMGIGIWLYLSARGPFDTCLQTRVDLM
jgi:NO-binding membrane sensor protein with MHYT domain